MGTDAAGCCVVRPNVKGGVTRVCVHELGQPQRQRQQMPSIDGGHFKRAVNHFRVGKSRSVVTEVPSKSTTTTTKTATFAFPLLSFRFAGLLLFFLARSVEAVRAF